MEEIYDRNEFLSKSPSYRFVYYFSETYNEAKRDEQNSWKEQPANKANGNRKSLGHLKGAKTTAR